MFPAPYLLAPPTPRTPPARVLAGAVHAPARLEGGERVEGRHAEDVGRGDWRVSPCTGEDGRGAGGLDKGRLACYVSVKV